MYEILKRWSSSCWFDSFSMCFVCVYVYVYHINAQTMPLLSTHHMFRVVLITFFDLYFSTNLVNVCVLLGLCVPVLYNVGNIWDEYMFKNVFLRGNLQTPSILLCCELVKKRLRSHIGSTLFFFIQVKNEWLNN